MVNKLKSIFKINCVSIYQQKAIQNAILKNTIYRNGKAVKYVGISKTEDGHYLYAENDTSSFEDINDLNNLRDTQNP